ncbi:hypothetical protein TUE45_00359 [Streptomyces reticuli]|nr:hypothetical protein TUE45_00359 [Streptomyces reticuli]
MRTLSPAVLGYNRNDSHSPGGRRPQTPSRRHPAHGERAARLPRAPGAGWHQCPTGACARRLERDVRSVALWSCGRSACRSDGGSVCGGCVPGVPGRGRRSGVARGRGRSTGGVRVSGVRPCRAWMAESGREGRRSRPFGYRRVTCRCREARGGRGVSAVGRDGAPRVSSAFRPAAPECPLAESSPQIRSSPANPSNTGADRRPTGGRAAYGTPVGARWRPFSRAPGLRARRRGTRGGDDPAAALGAHGASPSGRTVTQKHRQSTLRSTSGGCLCVTHREDCGRVPSKRRCRGVRIMPIRGRHALRLRILTPRFQGPGLCAPLSVHEPGGSRVIAAREVSPRGWVMSGWRAARPGSLRGRGRPRSRRVLHRMC